MKKTTLFLLVFSAMIAISVSAGVRETPTVRVVRDNAPTVVNISTERIVYLREDPLWGSYGNTFDTFFDQFFGTYGPRQALKLKSVGSGVVLDAKGLIVTNAHVVSMASGVYVILSDGAKVQGAVVYQDPDNDLALIKIDPPEALKAVKIAAPDDVLIGETVLAIGNPLGLENSVTSGIVSGKNRMLYTYGSEPIAGGLLQIDAPINPGNSGGALFNLDGELIGINVAVAPNAQNVGFAIPVGKIKNTLAAYQAHKDVLPAQNLSRKDNTVTTNKTTHDVSYSPEFNIKSDGKNYVMEIDTGGVTAENLNIKVENGFMTISGETSQGTQESGEGKNYSYHIRGTFTRRMSLPRDADGTKARTENKDKKVLIIIPKKG